jgi:hypothetical protein
MGEGKMARTQGVPPDAFRILQPVGGLYSLGEAARVTGQTRSVIRAAIKHGRVDGYQDGWLWQIDVASLHRLYPAIAGLYDHLGPKPAPVAEPPPKPHPPPSKAQKKEKIPMFDFTILKPGDKIILHILKQDIRISKCRDSTHCVIVNSARRQFALPAKSVIKADANRVSVPDNQFRYDFQPAPNAVAYVRTFDEVGEKKGEEAAREAMPEKNVVLIYVGKRDRRSPEQRARERQHKRDRRAAGVPRSPHKPLLRYVGT